MCKYFYFFPKSFTWDFTSFFSGNKAPKLCVISRKYSNRSKLFRFKKMKFELFAMRSYWPPCKLSMVLFLPFLLLPLNQENRKKWIFYPSFINPLPGFLFYLKITTFQGLVWRFLHKEFLAFLGLSVPGFQLSHHPSPENLSCQFVWLLMVVSWWCKKVIINN